MLVFTRRHGEAIIIGGGIEIRVRRVGREGVRLGVVAPASIPVHRQEVHAQISEANRAAVEDRRRPLPPGAGPLEAPPLVGHGSRVTADEPRNSRGTATEQPRNSRGRATEETREETRKRLGKPNDRGGRLGLAAHMMRSIVHSPLDQRRHSAR